MRRFIMFSLFLAFSVAAVTARAADVETAGKRVIFMPFYDDTGYRGPWDLKYEVPQMVGDMLGGADEYFYVVPMDTLKSELANREKKGWFSRFLDVFRNVKKVQFNFTDSEVLSIARKYDADIAITGDITDFNFHRWGAGDPMLGGYKSYTAHVTVEQVRILRVATGETMGVVRGEQDSNDRGLGLELFGKPRQMDLEFYSLDSLDFGSKRFLTTLMGQTAVEALATVHQEIRSVVTRPDSIWYETKKFMVISIDPNAAMINAGSLDGVAPGDRFNVFAAESGVRVGKISVVNVWSDHVSRAEILEGRDTIRAEDIILPE